MDYMLKKAKLLAKLKMSGGTKTPQKTQVRGEKETWVDGHAALLPAGADVKGAQESAKIAWIKARKKRNKMTLSAAEAKLPEPPAGTSTARR